MHQKSQVRVATRTWLMRNETSQLLIASPTPSIAGPGWPAVHLTQHNPFPRCQIVDESNFKFILFMLPVFYEALQAKLIPRRGEKLNLLSKSPRPSFDHYLASIWQGYNQFCFINRSGDALICDPITWVRLWLRIVGMLT
jgi:hypothetical protein